MEGLGVDERVMLKRMLTKWNMWQDVLNAVMKLKLLKLQGISWAAEELLACREGLGSVGLVNHMVRYIVQCTIEIVLLDCSSYIWISISVIFRNEKVIKLSSYVIGCILIQKQAI